MQIRSWVGLGVVVLVGLDVGCGDDGTTTVGGSTSASGTTEVATTTTATTVTQTTDPSSTTDVPTTGQTSGQTSDATTSGTTTSGTTTDGTTTDGTTTDGTTTDGTTGPLPVCGDATLDAGEECDDGNDDNTDACVDCKAAICGDNFLQEGVEECDDGNQEDTDACTNACTKAVCGDGIVGPGEMCDDGNLVDDDECSNACAPSTCGDKILQPGEECDDGNDIDTDACLNSCTTAKCGDMVAQADVEECDDGNEVDTDMCLNSCKTAKCGDMLVQAGVEECDDGNPLDTDMCLNSCKTAKCGDKVVQAGVEQCDDGNMVDNDACSNTCKLSLGLRANVLLCGSSSYDIKNFFPGGPNQFAVMNSCTPDNNTQAMIVTRGFNNGINGATLKTYLQNGGVVLTEFNVSDDVYSLAFSAVAQGPVFTGSCTDRAPTVVQSNPADPIWVAIPFQAITLGESGCGFPIDAFPMLTKIAGWSAQSTSIGYRDLLLGRLWLTDFDWQDGMADANMTYTNTLMGYMLTHRK